MNDSARRAAALGFHSDAIPPSVWLKSGMIYSDAPPPFPSNYPAVVRVLPSAMVTV